VGLIFYEEELTILKGIALLCMIAAIVFCVSGVDKSKLTFKALLYYIGIFVMNGMIGVLFTVHQNQPKLTAGVIANADGSFVVNNDIFMTWYGLSTVILCSIVYLVFFIMQKIKDGKNSSYELADNGSERSACYAKGKYADKQSVEYDIGASGQNCGKKAELWFFCSNKKALKYHLQNKCRVACNDNFSVTDTFLQHFSLSAEYGCDGTQKNKACERDEYADDKSDIYKKGKEFICFFLIALPKRFCNNGASSRAEHKSYGTQDKNEMNDKIYCRESSFSCKI